MRFIQTAAVMGGCLMLATGAGAQDAVPTETGVNGVSSVTLHVQPFLTEEELTTLRIVLTNEQALALFVPDSTGFAAMAAAPDDGFIRDGAAVKSAVALAGFADADAAATAALAACDGARTGETPCVVVLDIAPAAPPAP